MFQGFKVSFEQIDQHDAAEILALRNLATLNPSKPYFVTAASSGVVTETTDARVISRRRLSGGTRKCRESSFRATIVQRKPPLVTPLSPVLSSPRVACHFFWRRCCE